MSVSCKTYSCTACKTFGTCGSEETKWNWRIKLLYTCKLCTYFCFSCGLHLGTVKLSYRQTLRLWAGFYAALNMPINIILWKILMSALSIWKSNQVHRWEEKHSFINKWSDTVTILERTMQRWTFLTVVHANITSNQTRYKNKHACLL